VILSVKFNSFLDPNYVLGEIYVYEEVEMMMMMFSWQKLQQGSGL